jgi:hypothetical protein
VKTFAQRNSFPDFPVFEILANFGALLCFILCSQNEEIINIKFQTFKQQEIALQNGSLCLLFSMGMKTGHSL